MLLLARVKVDHGLARLALHVAAPVELAVTPFHVAYYLRVVPPAAAQKVAAVRSLRCPVAHPTLRAQNAALDIHPAVVGRAMHVHELLV